MDRMEVMRARHSVRSFTDRQVVPAAAQIEFVTKHEFSVQEHYAYIYFLRTDQKGEDRFCNLRELKAFGEKGLYSDLLQRYELLLRER